MGNEKILKEKLKSRNLFRSLLLGVGVIVATPFVAGLFSSIGFLGFEIIPGVLSLGTTLAAGISALVFDSLLDLFYKR